MLFRTIATALLIAGASSASAADDIAWEKGWISQSYAVPIAKDAPQPTSLLVNRWQDSGRALLTTDYLFAFDSQRSYIFNAGILRSGALELDQGTYRLRVFMDRFLSTGQPECRVRLAIDGSTVFDNSAAFDQRVGGGIQAKQEARTEAETYHEIREGGTPVLTVPADGKYRVDIWSFCRDLDPKTAVRKLTNERGNYVQKKGIFNTTVERITSFYGGNGEIKEVQEHRFQTNPIKQILAENHGTMVDLVLEDIETGDRQRINGENVYHNSEFTPAERLEFQALKPAGQGAIEAGPWVFTGLRGDRQATYTQRGGYTPVFRTAVSNMAPLAVTKVAARKTISVAEDGTYDFAIGYEPKMSGDEFLTWRDKVGGGMFGGGQDQKISDVSSEAMTLFLEKRLEDGRVRRLKVFEDQLVGSNIVGEVEFNKVSLRAGDYDLVISRDIGSQIKRDRYGDVQLADSFSNSQLSIRMKKEGEAGFSVLN